jgi:clan AA aspartic protease
MGLTYATLCLTRESSARPANTPAVSRILSVVVRALVDTGALFMRVPQSVATQLGFDVTEVRQRLVTLADGSAKSVPVIAPITIEFENRWYTTEALVLGDESLMGGIPMEAMDVMLDPRTQRLIVNPEHPNFAVSVVKGFASN